MGVRKGKELVLEEEEHGPSKDDHRHRSHHDDAKDHEAEIERNTSLTAMRRRIRRNTKRNAMVV